MCEDCLRDLNRYDPACMVCGQRYIRDIQKLAMPSDAKRSWLRAVLADWMRYGHAEADLRARPAPETRKNRG